MSRKGINKSNVERKKGNIPEMTPWDSTQEVSLPYLHHRAGNPVRNEIFRFKSIEKLH